jgi:hypothetical protein
MDEFRLNPTREAEIRQQVSTFLNTTAIVNGCRLALVTVRCLFGVVIYGCFDFRVAEQRCHWNVIRFDLSTTFQRVHADQRVLSMQLFV